MAEGRVGESVLRSEDAALLTGSALFVDDVHFDDMLHVAFVRSDFAHGLGHFFPPGLGAA